MESNNPLSRAFSITNLKFDFYSKETTVLYHEPKGSFDYTFVDLRKYNTIDEVCSRYEQREKKG